MTREIIFKVTAADAAGVTSRENDAAGRPETARKNRKEIRGDRKAHGGLTATQFLRRKGFSRHLMTYLRHHENTMLVNGKAELTSVRLKEGDELTVIFTDEIDEVSIVPCRMDLDIVYEDEDILVVNKPPYLPVQPSLGHPEYTLGNGVTAYYQDRGIPFVYRCVNRIDRNTSGLVLIARNMASAAVLYDAMVGRQIKRTYLAVAHGRVEEMRVAPATAVLSEGGRVEEMCVSPSVAVIAEGDSGENISLAECPVVPGTLGRTIDGHSATSGTADRSVSINPAAPGEEGMIDLPIARRYESLIERCVNFERGRRAVTYYRVLCYNEENDTTLLRIHLGTGRTHQIRVHMAYIGHPLVGDSLYGEVQSDLIPRQALHSLALDFAHPITGESMHLEAPLPDDIRSLLSQETLDELDTGAFVNH